MKITIVSFVRKVFKVKLLQVGINNGKLVVTECRPFQNCFIGLKKKTSQLTNNAGHDAAWSRQLQDINVGLGGLAQFFHLMNTCDTLTPSHPRHAIPPKSDTTYVELICA